MGWIRKKEVLEISEYDKSLIEEHLCELLAILSHYTKEGSAKGEQGFISLDGEKTFRYEFHWEEV